jgi:hypothetical protein
MKSPSPPLTYKPAYIGLFLSLFLAAVCNTFLDIQYGGFTFETIFWAIVFGITVRIAWRQQGEVTEAGEKAKKTTFIIGMIMSVLIFIPMWGFPRAGLAMLAMLQATQNCVTVNRRSLHMGLLVSAVMVMFASSHHRADWTMLFYLVPYIIAVVFTLVAEQISRRTQDLRRESLGDGSTSGQGVAIVAATLAILTGGALLYSITPQVTWPYLFWKYGQPGNIGFLGKTPGQGQTGQKPGELGSGGAGTPKDGESGQQNGEGSGKGAGGQPEEGDGEAMLPKGGWPSPEDMRAAAKRKGMPQWQSSAIMQMADMTELTQMTLTPIKLGLDELMNDIKEWLKQHWQAIIQTLMSLIVLALLVAAWLLLREARAGLWLRSRFDYLRLGLLRLHAPGNAGAFQYYRALQRLMDVQGLPRLPSTNAREYLAQIGYRYEHLRREMVELTLFFERARYGAQQISRDDLERVHRNYKQVFQRVGQLV